MSVCTHAGSTVKTVHWWRVGNRTLSVDPSYSTKKGTEIYIVIVLFL